MVRIWDMQTTTPEISDGAEGMGGTGPVPVTSGMRERIGQHVWVWGGASCPHFA